MEGNRIKHHVSGFVIRMRNHPRAWHKSGFVPEQFLIAEKILGKVLPEEVVIHHPNHNRWDNSLIVICENQAYHFLLHRRENALKACGHANWRKCNFCKDYDDPKNLYFAPQPKGYICHRLCRKEYQQKRNERNKNDL